MDRYYPNWLYDEGGTLDADLAYKFDKSCNDLAKKVEEVFAGVSYPGDENLTIEDEPYYGFFGNIKGVRENFTGKHWKEIPLDMLVRYRDSLSILSSLGYRFYLPSWMIATLLHYGRVDEIPLQTLHSFSGRGFYGWFIKDRVAGLNKDQRDVILEFLKFFHMVEDEFTLNYYGDELTEAIQLWENIQAGTPTFPRWL